MGPLVPDVVSGGMNLVLAVLLGIGFGFVLEQAGFSSSRKLTGLFYGRDFTVLRVFFTAGVTAMSGVLVLSRLGLLDPDVIYINPTFLQSAVLGGLIMGVGFVIGGFCPGTSVCAASVGRIDAMVFVAGGLAGVFMFGEAYPLVEGIYKAGDMGDLLISNALGISGGTFALIMIAVAVGAFVLTTKLEKKLNPETTVGSFPLRYHRLAAALVLVVGVMLAVTPDRKTRLLADASDPAWLSRHPVAMMTPDEAAFHILEREPDVQLVDVRDSADFAKMSLPGAVNVPAASMFSKEWRDVLGKPGVKYVFFGKTGEESVRAAALASLLGYGETAALQGGLDNFKTTILDASAPAANVTLAANVSSPQADTYRFRESAAPQIATLIKQRSAPKAAKAVKRVQGGCGG